jgi:phage gp45-like
MARNSGGSRGTCREIDDKNLCQQVKKCDVFHSETHSDIECWQPVGLTSVPLKQFEEEGKKPATQKPAADSPDFNHDQPKGKSAEALVSYVNGSRAHAIAMLVDRRVRPYNMKEGDAALYHASGTEQKLYINDDGAYLLANNNKSEAKDSKEKERFASLRHVSLKKQKHEIGENEQVQDHKHEGDSVNTEVRTTSGTIEFYAPGDKKVGLYDKGAKRWLFDADGSGNCTLEMLKDKITIKIGGSSIELTASGIKLNATRIDHN